VGWIALYEQFGQGYRLQRQFRKAFLNVLRLVLTQYPAARLEEEETGLLLRNSQPPVASRLVSVVGKALE
jgi:hypothetical protein